MRNDADLQTSRGARHGSKISSTFRAISSYWRSVSANASTIASSVRSAGAVVASTVASVDEDRQCEQVQWAGFDKLDLGLSHVRNVLLLTYPNGFQVWDVEDARDVRELVSRRDGPVVFLRMQPQPCSPDPDGGFKALRPLMMVATGDTNSNGASECLGAQGGAISNQLVATNIRFYSLKAHTYVHVLRFRTGICALRCSPRVIAVALPTQICCFDATTLQNTFSVLTYPAPQTGGSTGFGALAVGPRWLGYAANQPLVASNGRVSPQHLTPSPGASPSTSPASAGLVAHYAKESSKQIAAGIVTLGDMGYKTISRYCSELLPDGMGSPYAGSPRINSGTNPEPEHAGMVIVRDLVSKVILVQFRAHSSPLSALCFDPTGTILVTASVHGHSLNVFRLTPVPAGIGNSTSGDSSLSYAHLYKLCRGFTNAVIQDISFSNDSHWIAVSSSRGTNHLFAISPFGGAVGPQTHKSTTDGVGPLTSSVPWWGSAGPLRVTPQAFNPAPLPLNLSVISRIRNGVGGWRGTVSGAAAAATGRGSPLGAIAAVFHDGGGHKSVGGLEEKLWVLSASGYLIRYLLSPSAGLEGGYNEVVANGGTNPATTYRVELRLLVEPLEKWDVSRRPSWVEREEKIDGFAGQGVGHDEGSSGNAGVRENMSAEDLQRWFMSKAEVQMHQSRPFPIWAQPNISFHVVLAHAQVDENSNNNEVDGDELEIEKLPTRLIEVRRKDLKPVMERLQRFNGTQVASEQVVEGLTSIPRFQSQLLLEDMLQNGLILGQNYVSEGVQLRKNNNGFNGFHQSHQPSQVMKRSPNGFNLGASSCSLELPVTDASDSFAAGSPPLCGSPSFSQCSQRCAPNINSANRLKSETIFSFDSGSVGTDIDSPPIDIPLPSNLNGVECNSGDSSPRAKGEALIDAKEAVTLGRPLNGANIVFLQNVTLKGSLDDDLARGWLHSMAGKPQDLQHNREAVRREGSANHAEDGKSGHTKTEEHEQEHGEDALEGALFPFCEEDD